MRAIGVTTFGGPEQLHELELPEPRPGPGEVRIAVRAAAVNPADLAMREGLGIPPGLAPPYVPGMDVAGVVDDTGPGVDLAVGERVAAVVNPRRPGGGAYAEQVVVPADSAVRVPESLDLVRAATVPLSGLAATRALDLLHVPLLDPLPSGPPPSGTLAVTGAAGAVGGCTVQLAARRGVRVVADARDEDADRVRSLGADVVLPRGPSFAAAVRATEPGGVVGLVDAAVLGERMLPALRERGTLVGLRPFDGRTPRHVSVRLVRPADYLHRADWLDELFRLVAAGGLALRPVAPVPAAQAAQAHRLLAAGGARERPVLLF